MVLTSWASNQSCKKVQSHSRRRTEEKEVQFLMTLMLHSPFDFSSRRKMKVPELVFFFIAGSKLSGFFFSFCFLVECPKKKKKNENCFGSTNKQTSTEERQCELGCFFPFGEAWVSQTLKKNKEKKKSTRVIFAIFFYFFSVSLFPSSPKYIVLASCSASQRLQLLF